MTNVPFPLDNAPIVEAVVDIECDLPVEFALSGAEQGAVEAFGARFPKKSYQFIDEVSFEVSPEGSQQRHRRELRAIRFQSGDDNELVQVRPTGYSFNRLAPYESLDVYLPTVEREWRVYSEFAQPIQVTGVRLRYINRIDLPPGRVQLDDYFRFGTAFPYDWLTLGRVTSQFVAVEEATQSLVRVMLTDVPGNDGGAPFVLDIEVEAKQDIDPADWPTIRDRILDLRRLKNAVFRGALTEKCLQLFQSK